MTKKQNRIQKRESSNNNKLFTMAKENSKKEMKIDSGISFLLGENIFPKMFFLSSSHPFTSSFYWTERRKKRHR
jgi:hypothetical protein